VRSLARNTALAVLSEGSNAALFLLGFVAARVLGPEAFGQYGTAMALVGLFRILADLGLPAASTLAVSREPSLAGRFFGNLLGLQLLLGFVAVTLCLATGRVLHDGVTWIAVVVLCVDLLARAVQTTLRWVLRVFDRFDVDALTMTVERTLTLLLGVAALVAGGGVIGLVSVYASIRTLSAAGVLAWVRSRLLPLSPRRDAATWGALLRGGLPLAMAGTFTPLVVQLDSVLLETVCGAREVGLYRAPLRIVEGLGILPRALGMALLPALPALHARDPGALREAYRRSVGLLLLTALPVAVAGMVLPGPIVRLVFGEAYGEAAAVARLTLPVVVPFFVAHLGETLLACVGRARAIIPLALCALAVNVALALAWIPGHGRTGAAAATLAAVTVHAVLVTATVWRSSAWRFRPRPSADTPPAAC
jgi:O-antigen/teichoic acid export membrane protein